MSDEEKTIRRLPQHLRKWLREKKHQSIFKDEYKQIADDVKRRIEEREEQSKQLEFNFL